MITLIGNGILITRNADNPLINDGCVAVESNIIIDYGSTADMKKLYKESSFYDAKGRVIMPGLINAHGHIYSALARGMILKDSKPSKNFTEILENLWWRVDRSLDIPEIKYSAYTTYIDGIKNGVTTVFDHHASAGRVEGSLFAIADVAKELGVRTSHCYEVSDRDGEGIALKGIKENADFIKYCTDKNDDMTKAMFGMHASFTLSDKTLSKCVDMADGAGFHIHAAEGIDDVNDSLKKYNKRVVKRLYDAGILGANTIAVHSIHIDEDEMQLLKSTDTIVVHCPESNMGNAVGCADVLTMMDKGIIVGLGTDGYTTDMFESLKVANIIHKHEKGNPNVAWSEVPQMLFESNVNICSRFFDNEIGVVKKGALADIIVVDYSAPTPITDENINSHIIFGFIGRSVISTMINGKFVMKDRELQTINEEKVYKESQKIADDFWKRV